ncbi:MAG: 30S ribosomal protein S8 [Candidatus Peribacteraceae bacterium]|nr:30S ribosomal protein S8 [Candidatus Peribacteraceae bacterium]MDD5074942.1 30S ribosomal protein S8 [Candidatus Peribacteraceae bacterium]
MPLLNDPIGDLLTRIRNAQHAGRPYCSAPWSKLKEQLCALLVKEGRIASSEVEGEGKLKEIVVTFIEGAEPLVLKRVSKPGRRVYTSIKDVFPVLRGFGIAILTTSQGLMTDRDARKKKLGGELLCTIS